MTRFGLGNKAASETKPPQSFAVVLVPLHEETAETYGEIQLTPKDLPFYFGRRRHHNEDYRSRPRGGAIEVDDSKPIQVSRDHCMIDHRDGIVIVVDRGSTLGTIVNRTLLSRKRARFEEALAEGTHRLVLGNRRSRHQFDVIVTYTEAEPPGEGAEIKGKGEGEDPGD